MSGLDWLVVLLYAALIVGLGLAASRGQKSAESHLRADRSLPAWAVVFSVLATEISAATYVSVPEWGFKSDWTYAQTTFGYLFGKLLVATLFLQLFWRLNLPTVYGVIGQRIGPRSQRLTAWAFLCGRLIASGVRLFIAALAFSTATGFSIELAIVAMALLSTIYTWLGGLRAVVWTDVAQGTIFVIGAATVLVFALAQIDVPIGELAREAWDAGKLALVTWNHDGRGWLASDKPLPVAALGGLFLVFATHGTDQENVQHLLNTKSAKSSKWSIITSGLFAFPIVGLFLAVGTALWLYHQHLPAQGYDAADTKNILPNFVVFAMPNGLRGVVFAGLFAAAISSLGATLNATAAAWTHDIRPRGTASLRRVRSLTVVFGALLCVVALFFRWFTAGDATLLLTTALNSMTILYGGILGVFLVALTSQRRGSDASTSIGLGAGVLVGALLFFQKELFGLEERVVAWPWSIPLAVLVTLSIAFLAPRPRRSP